MTNYIKIFVIVRILMFEFSCFVMKYRRTITKQKEEMIQAIILESVIILSITSKYMIIMLK